MYAIRLCRAALISGLFCLVAGCGPRPGSTAAGATARPLARVWAVHDGVRVDRTEREHRLAAANAAWDGEKIRLFGARNEVVAFQVIVEAGPAGAHGVSVELAALEQRGGSERILYRSPGEDPTNYVGRDIQLFVASYLEVREPSDAFWVLPADGRAAPSDPTGWKPVQLVPENARRGGMPVTIRPGENQTFWVDVYLDGELAAGLYDGAVRVTVDGGAAQELPVELELFDFALPDENSMSGMVYFEPEQVELYHGRDLAARYHRFAHRHRIEFVHEYSPSTLVRSKSRFDGTAFTSSAGYEGPGVGVGNRFAPASFYGPGDAYQRRDTAWPASDTWMAAVAEFPGVETFLYMPDEPREEHYDEVRRLAGVVKSNPGSGGKLPVFVTSNYVTALDSAIDIWCSPPSLLDPSVVAKVRRAGKRMWFYNGARPASGALIIDAPPTDARVQPWIAFKHDVDTYFYWHANHWRHNQQKRGKREQNVWANSITFDNRGQPDRDTGFIHGDGVLVYPGQDRLHPDEDRGIAGPVSTLRLANLRRGLQDHILLTLARRAGLDAEVEEVLAEIVPRVLSPAAELSAVTFPEDGEAYERARRRLVEAIASVGR